MTAESVEGEGFVIGRNARVVCLGDSITEAADGYVNVMRNLVSAAYPERNIQFINAGISGNKAPDMLARLVRDVIARQPSWVTINVGINDVWHGIEDPSLGTPLEVYEQTLAAMIDHIRESSDGEIVLIEPTVILEDVDNEQNAANRQLDDFVAAMRRQADVRSTFLVPLHAEFVGAIRAGRSANPNYRLTTDGVHMNEVGNFVMALSVLYALGFGT